MPASDGFGSDQATTAPVLARRIDRDLRRLATPDRARAEKAYLKSDLLHLGVSVPAIRKTAKSVHREHPDASRDLVVGLVTKLWDEPVHERRMAAVELLDLYRDVLEARDLELVEHLIRESKTWALVDGLSATVAGALVERYPEQASTLDRWAADEDFWMRRSAMLALLEPLRRGEGDFDRFARYADAMLDEKEFFIRKAIGWVLRDVSKRRPDVVNAWIAPRTHRASGVTMREAVKYLPADQSAELMNAYRERHPLV